MSCSHRRVQSRRAYVAVCCRDDHGRLALHWAAATGHTELVSLLLGAAKAQKAAVEAAPADTDPVLLGLISKPVFDWQVGDNLQDSPVAVRCGCKEEINSTSLQTYNPT